MKKQTIIMASLLIIWATLSMSNNVFAQACSIARWAPNPVGADNMTVGTIADGNRRYAGPCGLNITLAGESSYLVDNTPTDEPTFNVRFYFFLDDVGEDVTFYQALDGNGNPVITAKYSATSEKVDVVFAGTPSTTVSVGPARSPGWNSLEIQWTSGGSVTPKAILGSASGSDEETASALDTSALTVSQARLGVSDAIVGSVPTGGSIDFDDYDSRRDTVPGRLCRGLTDSSRSALALEDVETIFNEFATGGLFQAAGTPDYNGDGVVDLNDATAVFTRFAIGQEDCSLNR